MSRRRGEPFRNVTAFDVVAMLAVALIGAAALVEGLLS